MKKYRLDDVLIARGFVSSKKEAFVVVTEGRILINGQKAIAPAQLIVSDARIVWHESPAYVGRGAKKLLHALDVFGIDPEGKICLDIGAAIGGFTQVLLERGAAMVYAVDTARGKFDTGLRKDTRVVVWEGADIRRVVMCADAKEHARYKQCLSASADLIVIDVSLVSLRYILAHISASGLRDASGSVIALLKPQYETRSPRHLKKGVVVNDRVREALCKDFEEWAIAHEWHVAGRTTSPITGSAGNTEYLYLLE
jgi:23S rRNA (cytidine1920-2'-O)/16S rRNA (cytidine1409-2'-O)-methyltransferase